MKALRLKIFCRQAGHTLLEVLVALGLIGLLLVAVSQFVDFSTAFQRINVSIGTQEKMRVVRSAIMQAAKDVDSDGYYELLLPELGALVPSSLNLGSYSNDEWGTPFLFCAYDVGNTNTVDSAYVSNSPPFASDYPLGRIISAGKDKTFQTTCVDATVLGDDIVLQITEADVRHANGGFGGFSHQTGEIKPVTPSDNINLQKSLVTPGTFSLLPLVDPQGNTILSGTLGYQTTDNAVRNAGLYIHDGLGQAATNWRGFEGGYCYTTTNKGGGAIPAQPACATGFILFTGTSGLSGWATAGGNTAIYYNSSVCCTSSNPVEYYVISECDSDAFWGWVPPCVTPSCKSGYNSIVTWQEYMGQYSPNNGQPNSIYRNFNVCSTQAASTQIQTYNLGGGSSHTNIDCQNAGGVLTLFPQLGYNVCEFNSATCPSGWSDTSWKYYPAQSKAYSYGCTDCSNSSVWSTSTPVCVYGCGCCGDNCTPMCSYSTWSPVASRSICN